MSEKSTLPFISPATGEQFGEVAVTPPEEVGRAMQEARTAQPGWGSRSLAQRIRIMRQFQQSMIDHVDELSEVISRSTGKSRQDGLIEVFMVTDMLSYQLRNARAWLKRERVRSIQFPFKNIYVEHRPYGVVAVIAPWNYPFALAMPPVLSALLAGNTVLLKPSEVTAATGVMIEKLFAASPELRRCVRVLHGGAETGAALVEARPDYIFLTGSTKTGQIVSKAAAEHLIPVALELGGKDPMIVLEDADLDAAARWGVWGALYNAGQSCVSIERVYVVEPVYEAFIEKAQQEMVRTKTGYSSQVDSPFAMGPVTDPRQVRTIERHLEDARRKGARVLVGGGQQGMFVEPVLLTEVDHSMLIMQEETFGPVLPVVRVRDEAEAVRMANDSSFGLSASIWSEDLRRAEQVARQVQAGAVLINDTVVHFGVAALPFGGAKHSGTARIHGRQGLLQFTQTVSYLVGGPPRIYESATLLRSPGNYWIAKVMLHLLLGITLKKRLAPLLDLLPFNSKKARPARPAGLQRPLLQRAETPIQSSTSRRRKTH